MIAVWIVAISFTTVGLIYSIPKYYKIFSCRAKTTGTLLKSQKSLTSDNKAIKATYEYYVDGKRYLGTTGWSTFAIFISGKEYIVKYNPKKPEQSFINMSGIYINCAIGTLFIVVGIIVFIIGIILSSIL